MTDNRFNMHKSVMLSVSMLSEEYNRHTVVFIRDALGTEVVCNPRYLYNGHKMKKLLSGQPQESRLFFDCVRDVVGVSLRVSNQQFYKNVRDHLQIVKIQVGYKKRLYSDEPVNQSIKYVRGAIVNIY